MAEKLVFFSNTKGFIDSRHVQYEFVPGQAPSQRGKNVINLHKSINLAYPNLKVLEISTKSNSELGKKLSAFNLKLNGCYFESMFQSSKVFSNGQQLKEIIKLKPIDAKRRTQSIKLPLSKFNFAGDDYPLEPRTFFYDYLYCYVLYSCYKDLGKELANYDVFTDIEFNDKKSINCQAKACAIYSFLVKNNLLDKYINDQSLFKSLYDSELTLV